MNLARDKVIRLRSFFFSTVTKVIRWVARLRTGGKGVCNTRIKQQMPVSPYILLELPDQFFRRNSRIVIAGQFVDHTFYNRIGTRRAAGNQNFYGCFTRQVACG